MKHKALKGFKDILPDEVGYWQRIEAKGREIFHRFGFSEIKVPILEKTDLFVRSIGEATDIVEKEMYTFPDRNGTMLTMRPEGTAPVLRAYIEHNLNGLRSVQRLYTIGPMFRHERPQMGRLRQFHQLSAEVLGAGDPRLDAEVMAMAWMLVSELGINVSLEINSLGCPECRPAFKEALVSFLEERADQLCEDCNRRLTTNPLRVLDCKNPQCHVLNQEAPAIHEHLCDGCAVHFQTVEEGLALLGIPARRNKFMVRGLDYYTRTTFELVTDQLGAQSAVGAGGRYDGLVADLGGPKVPGIGFALGIERLVLLMQAGSPEKVENQVDVILVALGEEALKEGFCMAHNLRRHGARVIMDHSGRSLKSQMKQADKIRAGFVLILGDEELHNKQIILRDMKTGEQEALLQGDEVDDWAETLAGRFKTARAV